MRAKTKKILTIAGVVLLLIATLGTFMAFFGKRDFNNFKDKVEDAFVKEEEVKENKNLILNPNFLVDSTGIEFKTHENVPTKNHIVDNWDRQGSENCEFEIYKSTNGLHVNALVADSSKLLYLQQYFSRDLGRYSDMPLTFAVSVNDIVYSGTFEFNDKNTGEMQMFTLFDSLVFGACYIDVSAAGYKVVFEISSACEFTINWVHLEEGNVFTGYVPPVIAE